MEPRVFNLLLKDSNISYNDGGDQAAAPSQPGNLTTAQLPGIRSFPGGINEDFIDPRLFETNKLPDIDRRYQNVASTSTAAASSLSAFESSRGSSTHPKPPPQSKKGRKSAVPLAEVLNSSSPQTRKPDVSHEYENSEPRKKRRLEGNGTRILPQPPSAKRSTKRQQFKTVLPPLLAPLHEPPPERGPKIVPSIRTKSFADRNLDLPPLQAGANHTEHDSVRLYSPDVVSHETIARVEGPIQTKKGKKKRKWSEEETKDLLQGVARFGIGSWKKILMHKEYNFNSRSAVDLKDKFRICCPDDYKKSSSSKSAETAPPLTVSPSDLKSNTASGRASRRKGPEELAALGINRPFFKSQRRERREFSKEEDEALLRGFEKYQAQWTKIRADPDLSLQSRSRTDLRDRFRNRYPRRFVEAGYKFRLKESSATAAENTSDHPASSQRTTADGLEPPQFSLSAVSDPPASASVDRASHSLNLLTASISDPQLLDYDMLASDDDPTTITLSRNIFAWADQNSKLPSHDVNQGQIEPSKTLSRLDQFHINPLLATKMTSKQSVPLSGILNGPAAVSLPGPSDLVSGLYADGSNRE